MPGPLKNPKHEAFAQAMAAVPKTGLTLVECYAQAGFKGDRKNASRLAKRGDILTRIGEIQAKVSAKVEVSLERWLQEVWALALFDLRGAVSWSGNLIEVEERQGPDDDGAEVRKVVSNNRVVFKDSKDLDPLTAACISEVKQGKDGSISIKSHSKVAALRIMGEYFGKLKPGETPAGNTTNNTFNTLNITADDLAKFMSYTPLERARRMMFALELAAREHEKTQAAPAPATIEGTPA